MKRVGEDLWSTEEVKLSGTYKSRTARGHSSGESLKWAPKVHGLSILISQAKGQRKNNTMIHFDTGISVDIFVRMIIQFCFYSQSILLCSGFSIYLPNMREYP